MNVIDAAQATVKGYAGGSESLGPRVGIGAGVLRNKVNPNNDTHHLTLHEADLIMTATGDHRILHALAAEHGYTLQVIAAEPSVTMIDAFLAACAAHGDVARAYAAMLADGIVTANEAKFFGQVIAVLMARAAEAAAQAQRAAGGAR